MLKEGILVWWFSVISINRRVWSKCSITVGLSEGSDPFWLRNAGGMKDLDGLGLGSCLGTCLGVGFVGRLVSDMLVTKIQLSTDPQLASHSQQENSKQTGGGGGGAGHRQHRHQRHHGHYHVQKVYFPASSFDLALELHLSFLLCVCHWGELM